MRAPQFALAGCLAALAGCASGGVPDPRDAAQAYADAAARGDADALFGMLESRSRAVITREELARKVADQREELRAQAAAIASPATKVEAEATVPFADGEHASLVVEEGEYRVASADALPAAARTPTQALEGLRRVLARRSWAGLLRVLSKRAREAVEADLRSLVLGLERPEGLDVRVIGDAAVVEVPGGHQVHLRREGGAWHVEDIE